MQEQLFEQISAQKIGDGEEIKPVKTNSIISVCCQSFFLRLPVSQQNNQINHKQNQEKIIRLFHNTPLFVKRFPVSLV